MLFKKYVQVLTSRNAEVFPSAKFTGTNCFIVGSQTARVMVDTGSYSEVDPTFAQRLLGLMQQQNFRISGIYLT